MSTVNREDMQVWGAAPPKAKWGPSVVGVGSGLQAWSGVQAGVGQGIHIKWNSEIPGQGEQ